MKLRGTSLRTLLPYCALLKHHPTRTRGLVVFWYGYFNFDRMSYDQRFWICDFSESCGGACYSLVQYHVICRLAITSDVSDNRANQA